MGRICCMSMVLLSLVMIGPLFAKEIVVCGTVADVSAGCTSAPGSGAAALPCSVSVRAGCSAAAGDLYFAKTNAKGYYSLTASLPDNCTNNYQFEFNGKKSDREIATVRMLLPQSNATDTLRQNLQLTIIDEAMPATVPAEVLADWEAQDGSDYAAAIDKMKNEYPDVALRVSGSGEEGYQQACHWRRVARLRPYADLIKKIMFCEHHNFGGIVVGYHDNVDAGNSDMEWKGSGKLCVLNFLTYYPEIQTLLSKDQVIRDPCISFDATKVLFAMSGSSSKGSGYSIYEMKIDDPISLTQLTRPMDGISTADFEPCYLPNGDIMFTSTRNLQLATHAFAPSTGMFMMSGKGEFMRRVGFDMAHTFFPVLRGSGQVLYTRWEHNDRDQTNCMGLFTMNPDGCHQTEYFGNQTAWPFTMIHGRPIPNSRKAVAIAGGHHGLYAGELMLIDNSRATNGSEGIQMIAPKRETKPTAAGNSKTDIALGGVEFLFEYPYPLSENDFLVSWRSKETGAYKLYWMDQEGHRELLAWGAQSVCQAVPIVPWKKIWGNDKPPNPQVRADYTKTEGTYTMENVYADPYCGLKKMDPIPQGTAKMLRVVELGYRAQGAGNFGSVMGTSAPAGLFAPAIFCPISAWGCSWMAKRVLGEAKIYDDGSAAFKVPARTPVYFQVLNEKGYCVATMRSWSTLMPGETFSCFGCHENKASAPPSTGVTQAMKNPPSVLEKPLGVEGDWFDFKKMVAPILDKNCAGCHTAAHESGFDMRNTDASGPSRTWTTSYNSLIKGIGVQSSNNAINIGYIFQQPEPEPYGSFGSTKSGMIKNIEAGHNDVSLTDTERKIIACWIDLCAPHGGYYSDYLTKTGYDKLEAKRTAWVEIEKENIKAFLADPNTGILPGGQDGIKATRNVFSQYAIRYISKQHALVVSRPVSGNFLLVDLKGRMVYRMEFTDRQVDNVVILLPQSLSRGLYAARLVGDGLTLQRMVNIIR